MLLANTPTQAETLLHNLKWAAAGIGLHVNGNKTEYMCFNQRGDISKLNGSSLKLEVKFTIFFQAAVVSILLYECTTWTLTKLMEKKLDSNYTRMLQAILNKSWRQHSKK